MTRTARRRGASDIYHVMARGVSRSSIFEDDADRERFLGELRRQVSDAGASIYAWCLMDNHYHLLIRLELSSLSAMMKAVNSSYAVYFNSRHDRVGHLFQGRFKSEPVDTEEYFFVVLRYIHQNPVKEGMTRTCEYRWSSYGEYLGEKDLAETELALGMFGSRQSFIDFHKTLDLTATCCDIDRARRLLSEEEARNVAAAVLGDIHLESIVGLERSARNDAIRKLRNAHLSVRQIERLTGVSRGIVARV